MPEMRRELLDAPGILLLGVVPPGGLFLEFPIGLMHIMKDKRIQERAS